MEDPRTPNAGVQVNKYLATVGLPGGYYWCAGYVKWGFVQNHVATPGCDGAARSFFQKKRLVYERSTGVGIDQVEQADVGSLYYVNLGRIGHIFWIDKWVPEKRLTATNEGNTGPDGGRNGDGVYNKIRPIRVVYSVARYMPPERQVQRQALPGRGNRLDTSLHRT